MSSGTKRKTDSFRGLDWMNARSKSNLAMYLWSATEQQKNLLEELAYKAKFKPTTESVSAVFSIDARLHGRWLTTRQDWLEIWAIRVASGLAVHAGLPAHERSRARTFAGAVASKAAAPAGAV